MKRSVYRSQSRQLLYTTMTNIEGDSLRGGQPLSKRKLFEKVEDITNVPRSTLQAIKKQGDEGEGFSTPGKVRPRIKAKEIIDSFDKDVIRRTVHDFYARREYPTLQKLLAALKDSIQFPYGRTTLQEILKEIGFKYEKCDTRSLLIERSDIVSLRRNFLIKLKNAREEGRELIFLDETWLNQGHTLSKCWQSDKCKGGMKSKSGKGRRLIILSAGSEDGFVPDGHLIFVANSKKGDYHDEMNGENFTKWFEEKLLPNIPSKTAIVLDNAPYHCMQVNRPPTTCSTKKKIQDWLTSLNIPWNDAMLKAELLEIVKVNKPEPKYLLQDMARAAGDHKVIFLPPYHCDLNPIELIWAQVKTDVARNNTTFQMDDVKKLCVESLAKVTKENWKKACHHAEKIEKIYWEKDVIVETEVDRLIINVNGDGETDAGDSSDGEYGDVVENGSGSSTEIDSDYAN